MTVGLFGGSFNPSHEGHAHLAEIGRRRLGLDRVIWLVSPQNPLKSPGETASLDQRLAGARRLARGPSMIVTDAESRLESRFTINTLRLLKARYPGVHFVWLMGADNLASFHKWKGWAEIMRLLPVAIVARPGSALRSRFSPAAQRFSHARRPSARSRRLAYADAPAWTYLRGPLNFKSSTAIRRAASAEDRI